MDGLCEILIPVHCKHTAKGSYLAEPVKSLSTQHFLSGARCLVNVLNGKTVFHMCNRRNPTIAVVLTSICKEEAIASIQNKPTSEVTPETTTDTHEVIHLSEIAQELDVKLDELSDNKKKQLLCFLAKNGSGFYLHSEWDTY